MMLQRNNYRIAETGGGFGVSIAVHLGIFLLIAFLMRMGPQGVERVMDEVTEIAYIEARYGEDVAKQVRMKTKPVVTPEPKPEAVEKTAEKAPEKTPEKPVEKPKIEDVEVKAREIKPKTPEFKLNEPKLQSRARLATQQPKIATRSVLKNKPMTDINAPKLSQAQQRQFLETTTKRLDSKRFIDAGDPKIDTSKLRNRNALSADVNAPKLASRTPSTATFKADNVALVGKKSSLDLSEVDFEVGSGSSGSGSALTLQLATGGSADGHAGLVGGQLEEGQVAYQGAVEDLLPTDMERRMRQPAMTVDLDAPEAVNPNARKTLLDYGNAGGAGGGASLRSRARSEAPVAASTPIVEEIAAQEAAEPEEAAQTVVPKKGVSMTVSGQIANRKIVHSVLPEYSAEARKRGWEGVVAVHFTVKFDGTIQSNMYFEQTSAHRDLNRAAMEAIRQFKFEPLLDSMSEQWGVITIVFRLN